MIRFEVIQKPASKKNPFGKETIKILQKRLLELQYNPKNLQKLVEGLECSTPSHADHDNEVIINEISGSVTVNACCDDFTATIRKALSGK